MSNGLSENAESVAALLQFASRIHFRLGPALQAVFAWGVHSSGKRALMRNLAEYGALTIPQMAAMRPVSRQFVRALVEELVAEGFVRLEPNPRHKTASLVALTNRGRQQAIKDTAQEALLLEELARDLPPDELRVAEGMLKTVLERLETFATDRNPP